jgi:hypothetical protein
MADRTLTFAGIGLASVLTGACGRSSMMTTPSTTPASPGVSVQALVIGTGGATVYGEGLTLTVRVMSGATTVSARLEITFADGSASVEVPFNPAGVRVTSTTPASLQASVPALSDPRMNGRIPGPVRAVVTLRDDTGREETFLLTLSVTSR